MAINFLTTTQAEVKDHVVAQMDEAASKKDLSVFQKGKLYAVKQKVPADIAEAFIKVRDRHTADLENVKNGKITAAAYADTLAKDFQQTLQSSYPTSLTMLTAMVNSGKKEGETLSSNLDVAMALAGTGKAIDELHPLRQMAHDAAKGFEKKKEASHATEQPQTTPTSPSTTNKPTRDTAGKLVKPSAAQPPVATGVAQQPVNKTQTDNQTQPPASAATTPPPPPPPPARPQSEFEKSYDQMAMGGIMISGAVDAGKADPKNANAARNSIVDELKTGIIAKLKPELTKRGVAYNDADVTKLADVASNTMYDYMQEQKGKNLGEGTIASLGALDAHSDAMALRVRQALAKENLGDLNDGMLVSYQDVIVGMSKDGKPQDRYGTSLHGLGSTMLAHAFGTEKVKQDHKQQMALDVAQNALKSQGSQLDIGTLEGTADTTLGSIYGVGTNTKIKSIIQKSFRGEDSSMEFGDITKAWNEAGEKDIGGGMLMRFLMFLDALLYKFTGYSFIGATNNPIITAAEENANERRVVSTYEGIIATSPTELGVKDEKERLQLAERVTGLRKTGGEPAFVHIGTDGKEGGYSGLFANIMGLSATGTAPDSDIKPHTPTTTTTEPPRTQDVSLPVISPTLAIAPDKIQGFNQAIAQLREENKDNPALGNLLPRISVAPALAPSHLQTIIKDTTEHALADGKVDASELKIITGLNKALKDAGLSEAAIPVDHEGSYHYIPPASKPNQVGKQ